MLFRSVGDQGFAENSVQILVGGKAVCVFYHLVGNSGKSCMTLGLSLMSDCFMMESTRCSFFT